MASEAAKTFRLTECGQLGSGFPGAPLSCLQTPERDVTQFATSTDVAFRAEGAYTRLRDSRSVPASGSRRSGLIAVALLLLLAAPPLVAQGVLSVEVLTSQNLIVDSNVTSPLAYSPSAAYVGARVCNKGNAPLGDVIVRTGDRSGGNAGVFPSSTFSGPIYPHLAGSGSYALRLESGDSGASDGTRYLGTVNPNECRIQYWLVSYPRCVNNSDGSVDTPPCAASIVGTSSFGDDPSLDYDVWATTTSAISQPVVSVARDFTLRSSAASASNKIWPNTGSQVPADYRIALQSVAGWGSLGADGQPFDGSNAVLAGQRIITTRGVWYDLGPVSGGFDSDGDLVPDQNAWLQPVGDARVFDAGCFRLVNSFGVAIAKLKSGGEVLVPFQNQLYFAGIPENNGVVGLVFYQFVATREGCSARLSPYQKAAAGPNAERYSADFGLTFDLISGTFDPNDLVVTKSDGLVVEPGTGTTSVGNMLTYTIDGTNSSGANLGEPDFGTSLSIRDSIRPGTVFVAGSADDTPATNLVEPSGTGSYMQEITDVRGNLDGPCTVNYTITGASWAILYSTDGGDNWTTAEPPANLVTDVQWQLSTSLQLDGGHDGDACIAPDGLYDNGFSFTSLPAGKSFSVHFQTTVAPTTGPVICNTATLGFGGSALGKNAEECTHVAGNNTIAGTLFRDNAGTSGVFGNGIQDNATETGIGAGVEVTLYFDVDGNGELDFADRVYGTATTNASGDYGFASLPDGRYLVVVNKYDDGTGADSATDTTYATSGWGSTTPDPNAPLTTDTGAVRESESATTVVLAVNVDLDRNNGAAVVLAATDFGFAPALLVTKDIQNNSDVDNNGIADSPLEEGSLVTYTISLRNRLPSAGMQGPIGCQYTAWGSTGGTGAGTKSFTSPANAFDSSTPNRTIAYALVEGGASRWIYGSSFGLARQLGGVSKVEALFYSYFDTPLTDDFLNLTAGLAGSGLGANGITGTLSTTTLNAALIDNFVGPPAGLQGGAGGV